jgi:hypothetical protein
MVTKTKNLVRNIKHERMSKCWVITCLPCKNPHMDKESPGGCIGCGIMDWLPAFETEEECNKAYKEEFPNEFDENGKYIGHE